MKRYRSTRSMLRGLAACLCTAALTFLAGCGPIHLVANTNIPAPLVVKIPVGVALFIPQEFSQYVHREERWSTDWNVELGKAQTEGIQRLMTAMFERVVVVDSINAGTQLGSDVRAILEPSVEEYAFVTPRDAGSPFFAVSIKYRVNVYSPDGKLADSWGFTGYGTSPSQGLSSQTPLAIATALAMRDAGAKLAVEFREQAIVRGLLPDQDTADTAPKPAPPQEVPAPAESGNLPAIETEPAGKDTSTSESKPNEDPSREQPSAPAGEEPAVEDSSGNSDTAPAKEDSSQDSPGGKPAGEEPSDEKPSSDEGDEEAASPPEALAQWRPDLARLAA